MGIIWLCEQTLRSPSDVWRVTDWSGSGHHDVIRSGRNIARVPCFLLSDAGQPLEAMSLRRAGAMCGGGESVRGGDSGGERAPPAGRDGRETRA